jgi:uncharacterized membrane protein YvbJ
MGRQPGYRKGELIAQTTVSQRYCSNCGKELSPDGRFCPSCGQAANSTAQPPTLEPATPTSSSQRPSSPTRTWGAGRVLLLVIVAPVLLAVALFVFLFAYGFLTGLIGG